MRKPSFSKMIFLPRFVYRTCVLFTKEATVTDCKLKREDLSSFLLLNIWCLFAKRVPDAIFI